MKMTMTMILILVGVMSITGCTKNDSGGDNKNDGDGDNNTISKCVDLQGEWEITTSENGKTFVENRKFTDCNFVFQETEENLVNIESGALFEVGTKIVQPNNEVVKTILVTVTGNKSKVTSIVKRDEFNSNNECGFNDWEVNVVKDLTNTPCSEVSANQKNIYLVEDGKLYMEPENAVKDTDGYSSELDKINFSTKK